MNKSKKKTRGQLNNAGFSFVELIIAVAILAVIVIPIYRLFITSAKFNNSSRIKLRTTTLAADVMEGLKAYTIEDLKKQFSATDPDVVEDEDFRFKVIDEDMLKPEDAELPRKYASYEDIYDYNVADKSAKVKNDPVTGEALDGKRDEDGKYYFFIHNVQMQENSSLYDVRITIDPTGYEKGDTPLTSGDHKVAYNSVDYSFWGVNKDKSGIIGQDDQVEALLVNDIVDSYYDDTTEDSDYGIETLKELVDKSKYTALRGHINRKITIFIEKDTVSGENVVSVSCQYEYPLADGTNQTFDGLVDVSGKFSFSPKEYLGGEEYTCYLIYYPNYFGSDSFTIKNESRNEDGDNVPVDFYVIQQANAKYGTDISSLEAGYNPSFNVTGDVLFHTNLGSSMNTSSSVYSRKDSSTGLPTDATTKSDELKWPVQIGGLAAYKTYSLNGVPLNSKAEADPSSGTEGSDVIFDVTVDIFEAIDADTEVWKTWDRSESDIIESMSGSMFR